MKAIASTFLASTAFLLSSCGLLGGDDTAETQEPTGAAGGINPVVPGTISDAMTNIDRKQAIDLPVLADDDEDMSSDTVEPAELPSQSDAAEAPPPSAPETEDVSEQDEAE